MSEHYHRYELFRTLVHMLVGAALGAVVVGGLIHFFDVTQHEIVMQGAVKYINENCVCK